MNLKAQVLTLKFKKYDFALLFNKFRLNILTWENLPRLFININVDTTLLYFSMLALIFPAQGGQSLSARKPESQRRSPTQSEEDYFLFKRNSSIRNYIEYNPYNKINILREIN